MSKKQNNKKQKEKTEQSSSPKRLLIPLSLSAEEAYEAMVAHLKVKPEVKSEQKGEELQVVFPTKLRSFSKAEVRKRLRGMKPYGTNKENEMTDGQFWVLAIFWTIVISMALRYLYIL